MIPRDYQHEAKQSIFNYFVDHTGNPIVAMPTGTGKSIVIGDFLRDVFKLYPYQRVIMATHVKELIEQNFDKLLKIWPVAPAGIYSAGLNRRDTNQPIIFAGIGSVAKRAAEFGHIDLMLIDEAHLVSPNQETMYQKFISALKEINPHLKVIGLTATPWRLGQGKLTEDGIFTDICFDLTALEPFNRLIDEGYLIPLIPKKTNSLLDVDGVHMRGGEFIQKELQAAVDIEEITYAALRETMELGYDRKSWLIFTTGIDHCIHAADMLTDMGIRCEAVHSKTKASERRRILNDYRSGKLRAVTNNNVLTTGFDHPDLDLITVLRPTASPVLWVQMLGRGTRPVYAEGYDLLTTEGRLSAISASHKQNCLVLDFAGNTKRLGPINDPVIPKKKGKKKGDAPVKLCEQCEVWNHASVKYCVCCGAEFIFEVKLKQEASTDELIKSDAPIVEVFQVDHITYSEHKKLDRPPSMKVSYYCGLRLFEEYVCIEHPLAAGKRARKWWKERAGAAPTPETVEDLLHNTGVIAAATQLRVWINKRYPEVIAYCYDGTAFGQQEATAIPTTNYTAPVEKFIDVPFNTDKPVDDPDEIPF